MKTDVAVQKFLVAPLLLEQLNFIWDLLCDDAFPFFCLFFFFFKLVGQKIIGNIFIPTVSESGSEHTAVLNMDN